MTAIGDELSRLVPAGSDGPPRALVGGLVLDGTGEEPQANLAVVLAGDRIAAVRPRDDLEPGVEVVDLGGRIVMPGLIDCHAHFALWALDPLGHQDRPHSQLVATTFRALADVLRAGCTAVRDPGGLDAGYRTAIDAGLLPGPRIQTAITIVSPINGIADGSGGQGIPVPYPPGMPSPECTGPVEARAKVREVIRAGADFIKIAATGGVASERREPTQPLFTVEELEAIVDEAHSWGRPVACHAIGGPGVLRAIRAGVDTIEHGVWLEDEAIAEMAARGTWYVPTLAAYVRHAREGAPLQRSRAEAMLDAHRESVRRARAAGIRIAAGSDGGVYGHDLVLELEQLVEAGLAPGEAIVAATSRAATCLGWGDEIGNIRAGLAADLLVIDGNPSRDLGVLRTPGAVRVIRSGIPVPPA